MRRLTATALLALPTLAHAHAGPAEAASEPLVVALLVLAGAWYALGVTRLWRRAGPGRGATARQAASFAAGLAVLALALVSPLDAWAAASFTLHMIQHEALMLVAAPLLVLGRPLGAFAWALPARARRGLHALTAAPAPRAAWTTLTAPVGATVLQLAILFAWHAPPLFRHALVHPWWHALQHACFLFAALAFWWAMRGAVGRARPAPVIMGQFVTMLGTGALGALLTFAATPWYLAADAAPPWFGSALEDQQVGGLLMWVPGGTAYMAAALAVMWRLLARRDPRTPPRLTPSAVLR
ncbi:MAG: cytochrome c oxidase assembly protein [Burkholderiales bacterium]